ncbi:hypothetical protein ABTN15_19925, partial [Acinetobacter baumannii]
MTAITLGRYAVDYEVKARYWVLINASSPDDAIAQVNALLGAERAVLPDSTPVAFDANAEAAKCVHEPIN